MKTHPKNIPNIPNIPERLSGEGGLNFNKENRPPMTIPNNPALNAVINSCFVNSSIIEISSQFNSGKLASNYYKLSTN